MFCSDKSLKLQASPSLWSQVPPKRRSNRPIAAWPWSIIRTWISLQRCRFSLAFGSGLSGTKNKTWPIWGWRFVWKIQQILWIDDGYCLLYQWIIILMFDHMWYSHGIHVNGEVSSNLSGNSAEEMVHVLGVLLGATRVCFFWTSQAPRRFQQVQQAYKALMASNLASKSQFLLPEHMFEFLGLFIRCFFFLFSHDINHHYGMTLFVFFQVS